MSASGPEATAAAASAALFTTAARAQALASVDATRTLDADALRFIDQQIVGNTHQEVLYKGWAEVQYSDRKFKPRLIVVSTFRLYILKPGPLGGLGIRQSFLLAHLRTAAPGSLAGAPDLLQMALTFDDDSNDQREFNLPGANFGTINIAHKCVDTILQAILFSAEAIRTGRPSIATQGLPIPWLDGYRPPNPDDQDGLLAAYLAECDRVGIPQRIGVLDYFMTCFQLKDTMMDLRAALGFLDGRDCAKDVLAIVSALKYSTLFTTFVCVDLTLRNEGAAALATMFSVPTVFTKLVLVNCRISRPAMTALGAALAKSPQPIDHLIISRSDIGDAGIASLCEGLGASTNNRPIASICLSAVDMGPKGLRALVKLLRQPHWVSSVRALDLTDNPLGKSGTDVLSSGGDDGEQGYLRLRGLTLEQLILRRCDLDTERLLAALLAPETKLPHTTLSLLDISGNRITKKAVAPLAQLVTSSRYMSCLSASASRLEPSGVAALLTAAMDNRSGVSFSFDFSCNELGTKGVREITQALADKAAKAGLPVSSPAQNVPPLPLPQSLDCVQYLDLSETQMNAEALTALVRLLAPFALDSLKLDRCFKPSLFAKPQDAGAALATILASLPALTELSVAGDGDAYYLGRALLPLLAAAAKHDRLTYIDFRDNRAGDEGLTAFANAAVPGSALRGASLDGSRAGLPGFHALLGAVQANRRLVHLVVPEHDLSRLLRTLPPSRASEVQVIIHSLDLALDRNENNLTPESAIHEDDDEDDTASETASVSRTSVSSGTAPTATTGPPPFPGTSSASGSGSGSYTLTVPGVGMSRIPSRSPMSSRPSSAGPPSLPGSSPGGGPPAFPGAPPTAPPAPPGPPAFPGAVVPPPIPNGPPAFIPPTPSNRSATPPVKPFMPGPPPGPPAPPAVRGVRSKRMSVITQGLDLGPISAPPPAPAPAATGPPPPGGIALALPSLFSATATSAAAARAAANAPRGSLFGTIAAPAPAAAATVTAATSPRGGGGAQRMSVAAGSYSDMMVGLKSAKALRKMTTRHFDASVHALAAAAAAGMTVESFHGGDSAPTPAVSPSAPSSPAAQSVAAAVARKAAQGPMRGSRPATPSVSGTATGAVAVATDDDGTHQTLRIQYAFAPSTGAGGGSSRGSFAGPAGGGASTPLAGGTMRGIADADIPKHRRVATAAAGLRPVMAPPVPQAPGASPQQQQQQQQDGSDPRHRRIPTAGPGLQSAGFAAAAAAVAAAMKRRNEQEAASPTGNAPGRLPIGIPPGARAVNFNAGSRPKPE